MNSNINISTPRSAAAYWFARQESGNLEESENAAFQAWLQSSEENRAEFEALEKIDGELDFLADELLEETYLEELEALDRRHQARGKAFRWSAIAASVAVFAVWVTVTIVEALPEVTSYSTGPGESQLVNLDDGSRLHLNTDTVATVSLDEGERDVKLERGELYLDVMRNETRPFKVRTANTTVTVLGTSFSVRAGKASTTVSVVEGNVQVEATVPSRDAAPVFLAAGEEATGLDGTVEAPVPFDAVLKLAWRDGWLRYRGTPLEDVVADMNRYTGKTLVVSSTVAADMLVTADFRLDRQDEMIAALAAAFDLVVKDVGNGTISLERKI